MADSAASDILKVEYMDIFDSDAEVMVFSTNPGDAPAFGSLDFEVYLKAGFKDMMKERRTFLDKKLKDRDPKFGDIHISKSYELGKKGNFKFLIQVITPKDAPGINLIRGDDMLAGCYKDCLKKAKERGAKSVVFPLLGTSWVLGYSENRALKIAEKAISEFLSESDGMTVTIARKKNSKKMMDFLDEGVKKFNDKEIIWAGHLLRLWEDGEIDIDECDDYGYFVSQIQESAIFDNHARRLINEAMRDILISREVEEERAAFYEKNKKEYSDNEREIDRLFAREKVQEYLIRWLKEEPKKGEKHLLGTSRSLEQMARIVGCNPSTVQKLMGKKGAKPSREKVLAYAIAMKLDRDERVKLMLCVDPGMKYPKGKKETIIEELLCGPYEEIRGDNCDDFDVIDSYLIEKHGPKMSIYQDKKSDIEPEEKSGEDKDTDV